MARLAVKERDHRVLPGIERLGDEKWPAMMTLRGAPPRCLGLVALVEQGG